LEAIKSTKRSKKKKSNILIMIKYIYMSPLTNRILLIKGLAPDKKRCIIYLVAVQYQLLQGAHFFIDPVSSSLHEHQSITVL